MKRNKIEYDKLNEMLLGNEIFELEGNELSGNGISGNGCDCCGNGLSGNGLSSEDFHFEFDPNDFILDEEIKIN